ncbi:ankyrin repeat-containing domain protein [Podospora appendiculata]|uniref:Ankyrin repeat-containing domain protein n=1 Tax=Podospora appendiculata TaxID=314037 RepID=A0AAE0WYT2_9PEZI|nr:ankyrin repeat-containing domain protein [Podospora appendiculata]
MFPPRLSFNLNFAGLTGRLETKNTFLVQTRLEEDIAHGNLDGVLDCLANGASPNYRVGPQSPLCQAIATCHHGIMTCLLDHGADMSFDDSEAPAQPEIEAYQPTIEAYELLIADSLAVRNTPTWVGIALQGIIVPCAKALAKAIIARAISERQAVYPMFLVSADGPKVLKAVQNMRDPQQPERYMLTLLRHGIFPRFVSTDLGGPIRTGIVSALQFGISHGQVKVIEEMFDLGVDINMSFSGSTLLYVALERLEVPIIKLLLDRGADVNCIPSGPSDHGWTNRILLDETASHPIFQALPFGSMPTHEAETCLEVMSLLLDAGTDVDIRTGGGKTLLAAAVENKSEAAVRLLLASGADANLEDDKGRIPLQLPVYSAPHVTEIVRLLIPKTRDINHQDNEGTTPLIALVRNNSNLEAVKLLLAAGASSGINMVSKKGTALLNATWWVTEEMLGMLLDAGADPNITGSQGDHSALMSVASVNTSGLPLIRLLLERGADAAYADATGNTALHVVVESTAEDALESARLLVQHGANVNAARSDPGRYYMYRDGDVTGQDASPVTPLALAIQCCMNWAGHGPRAELAVFLARNGSDTSLLSGRLREKLRRLMGDPDA